jgi:tRNA(Ile)-lysidine synthase
VPASAASNSPPAGEPAAAKPLGAAQFASLIEPLLEGAAGETLAVATSGGADSLALALLAAEWAATRGHKVVALTVDHGLRAESAAEAASVHGWLSARGVPHVTLKWRGPKPAGNRQAAARAARYGLLAAWCRRHGVRHLLLAHQLEDQAETFLLRAGRGSGVDGLAAMAASSQAHGLTLLRPLLDVPKARLIATLQAREQPWIEDPSNRDPHYSRTLIRQALALLAPAGLGAKRLADTARRMARTRRALEAATGDLLARAARFDPAGFCRLDRAALAAAPEELGLRALARVLATVSGDPVPPRLERLERLYHAVTGDAMTRGKTLKGCRILAWRGELLVCREPAAVAAAARLQPGQAALWDGRFSVRLGPAAAANLRVGALGTELKLLDLSNQSAALAEVPWPARASLPALWQGKRVLAVPQLAFCRPIPAAESAAFAAAFITGPSAWVATPSD